MPDDPKKAGTGFTGLSSLASRVDLEALENESRSGARPTIDSEVRARDFTHFPISFAGWWKSPLRIAVFLVLPCAVAICASFLIAAFSRLNQQRDIDKSDCGAAEIRLRSAVGANRAADSSDLKRFNAMWADYNDRCGEFHSQPAAPRTQ